MSDPPNVRRASPTVQRLWLGALAFPGMLHLTAQYRMADFRVLHSGSIDRPWMLTLAVSKTPALFVMMGALLAAGSVAALVALVKRSSRALAVGLGAAVLLWTVTFSAIAATYPWGSTLYVGLAVGRRYQPIYTLWIGAAMITLLCAALGLAQMRVLWASLRWRAVLGIPTLATVVAWGTVVMLADMSIVRLGDGRPQWLFFGLPIAVIAILVGLAQIAWERAVLHSLRKFVKSWWIWF